MQRFPISTLTAVALMDGIVESLVQRYLYQATLKIKAAASIFNYSSSTSLIARENRRRRRKGSSGDSLDLRYDLAASSRNRKKYVKKAERASEGVRCDIQALVGITDVSLSFKILVFLFFILMVGRFEGPAVRLSELVFETPLIDYLDAPRSLLYGRRQLV